LVLFIALATHLYNQAIHLENKSLDLEEQKQLMTPDKVAIIEKIEEIADQVQVIYE
jgi:hypothetical protein